MKDHEQEMMREIASRMVAAGFEPMGMEAAKEKLEQHLNGGISSARDRLRESAQCEQTVLALNDLLNETQKKAMLLVQDNDRLRAELAELRKQPAAVPEAVTKDAERYRWLRSQSQQGVVKAFLPLTRCHYVVVNESAYDYPVFDEAIDAAILSATDDEVKNGT